MTARDRPARRCIASGDDRRCERGHPHSALALGLRAAARVASLPTWNVTGGLSQIRTHTRRLERSCFTSLRSAHGPRPSLCGLIQPPAARYRPSRSQRGLNAQRNVALCGRPVAAKNTHPPSRAVVLHLTAERSWTEALPLRPDSAASRTLSPFPVPARPKCATECGPVLWRTVAPPMYPPFTQAVRFGHGEVRVCRNQRVVRAGLISRPHRCFGDHERSGRPFHRHWSDFEPSRQFKAPWQA